MLWFVCFLNYADRQAISSVFPLLTRQYHFDDVQLGWLGSAFAWVYAAAAPLAGLAADRVGRTLLVLDTVTGGDAERLNARHGWRSCGEIPHYALLPDGRARGTTVFFKALAGRDGELPRKGGALAQ